MLKIQYSQDSIVTPECCYIKDWNINLSCKDKNTISITYYNNTLYCIFDGIHDVKHRQHCDEPDFLELRLWIKEKIMAIWTYNKDNIATILSSIQQKLLAKEYISNKEEKDSIDLYEYDLLFLTYDDVLSIVRCSLVEFYLMPSNEIMDNRYERQYHILTPDMKEKLKRTSKYRIKQKQYYDESERVLKTKLGNMDLAEYHLLIYGE